MDRAAIWLEVLGIGLYATKDREDGTTHARVHKKDHPQENLHVQGVYRPLESNVISSMVIDSHFCNKENDKGGHNWNKGDADKGGIKRETCIDALEVDEVHEVHVEYCLDLYAVLECDRPWHFQV